MKKLLFIAMLPLLFSACKAPEPPASVENPAPTAAAPQPAVALPKGIALSVPYTVISDDWTNEEDARNRKTVIEFEVADAGTVGREITASMAKARYRLTGTSQIRGGERFNFRGDPGLRVTILVRPRGAVALQNGKSTGNIEISYTELPEAAAPEQDSN